MCSTSLKNDFKFVTSSQCKVYGLRQDQQDKHYCAYWSQEATILFAYVPDEQFSFNWKDTICEFSVQFL